MIHVHKYTICNQYLILKKRETHLLREIKLEFESSLIAGGWPEVGDSLHCSLGMAERFEAAITERQMTSNIIST